jgi:hypothetical protein
MNTKLLLIPLILLISLFSCKQDDTDDVCTTDCTTIQGKIIRADNSGIEGVKVTFSYIISTPNYSIRNIADTYTDQNGNYSMSGYINDSEIDITKKFKITIDTLKVQSSLSNEYLKTKEIQPDILSKTDNIIIEGFESRPETINVVDYIVPFKSNLTINLNNFEPIIDYDLFGFESKVEYGFRNQKVLTKSANANSVNTHFNVITGIGENEIKVRRIKNGEATYSTETIMINESPSNVSLNFEY